MSKFRCTCGNLISDVRFPNEVTGRVLSDKSGDEFLGVVCATIDDYLKHLAANDIAGWRRKHFNEWYPNDASGGVMIHDVLITAFFGLTLAVMECDGCGRLWCQTQPGVNRYRAYSPDHFDSRVKILGWNR